MLSSQAEDDNMTSINIIEFLSGSPPKPSIKVPPTNAFFWAVPEIASNSDKQKSKLCKSRRCNGVCCGLMFIQRCERIFDIWRQCHAPIRC